jgi:hypothetical protein
VEAVDIDVDDSSIKGHGFKLKEVRISVHEVHEVQEVVIELKMRQPY